MKKKNNSIKAYSKKMNYSRPQLQKIGKVNNITMGSVGGNFDSGNMTPAS